MEEEVEEHAPPLKRKNEKVKDARTSEAVVAAPAASSIEQLAAKAAKKSKKLKDDFKRLREGTKSFLTAKKKGREERRKELKLASKQQRIPPGKLSSSAAWKK